MGEGKDGVKSRKREEERRDEGKTGEGMRGAEKGRRGEGKNGEGEEGREEKVRGGGGALGNRAHTAPCVKLISMPVTVIEIRGCDGGRCD